MTIITPVLNTRAGVLRFPNEAAAILAANPPNFSSLEMTNTVMATREGVLRFPNEAARHIEWLNNRLEIVCFTYEGIEVGLVDIQFSGDIDEDTVEDAEFSIWDDNEEEWVAVSLESVSGDTIQFLTDLGLDATKVRYTGNTLRGENGEGVIPAESEDVCD